MISVIIELIKSGLSFFQKKQEKEIDKTVVTTQETNETNREEIKKGFSGRNFLFLFWEQSLRGIISLYLYLMYLELFYSPFHWVRYLHCCN